jgi:NTE family protein
MVFESLSTGLNRAGAEWRNTLSLGEYAGLRSEWYQPTGALSEFFVQPYVDYRSYELPLLVDGSVLADFQLSRTRLGFDVGWNLSPIERISVGLVRGRSKIDQQVGGSGFNSALDGNFGAFSAAYVRDTLDSAVFPTTGSRVDLGLLGFREGLGSENGGEVLRLSYDRAWNAGRHRWLLGARGQLAYGEPDVVAGLAELGGFLNVSGYGERELLGLNSLLLRGVYYRRLGSGGSLFSLPAYVGGSLEAGNVWLDRDSAGFDDLRGAASIFVGVESPLGPVFLGYGRSERGIDSFYLHFGSLLRPAVP